LERIRGIVFYTNLGKKRNEETYPAELLKSTTFTKGYLICFPSELFEILKQYKYSRKHTLRTPEVIAQSKRYMTLKELLDNKNFSKNI